MTASEATALHRLLEGGGERNAVVVPGGPSVTYDGLAERAAAAGARIARAGAGPGDVVAMVMGNTIEFVETFLGATAAGATAAPLNPDYRASEFESYFGDAKAKLAIVEPEREAALEACRSLGLPYLVARPSDRGTVFEPDVGRTSITPIDDPSLPALFLHTSGTTSKPKGVPLTHANLTVSAGNSARSYELGPDDAALCVMPLFHIHGLVGVVLATLRSGGTVILPPRFSATAFWGDAVENGATWYSGSPTIHQILLMRAAETPPPREVFRFARSCSAALAPSVLEELEETIGAPVIEAYGMTEAAHQMASNPLPPGERRPGTVGRGTGVEIALLDDAGIVTPSGGPGEVVIRGPNVMGGYRDNEAANAEAFVDGWFRTGDQGVIGEDGYLQLTGRLKELINRGGEKISPLEVDAVLSAHPAVAEAVSFGVPDVKYGEEVHAAVVLRGDVGVEELQRHAEASLVSFKVPKVIHVASELPKTATGKVQRRHVAQAFSGDTA